MTTDHKSYMEQEYEHFECGCVRVRKCEQHDVTNLRAENERLKVERAEEESIVFGVEILCRHQKKHDRYDGCLYCKVEKLERENAELRQQMAHLAIEQNAEFWRTYADDTCKELRRSNDALQGRLQETGKENAALSTKVNAYRSENIIKARAQWEDEFRNAIEAGKATLNGRPIGYIGGEKSV